MSSLPVILRNHLEYDVWAYRRLLEAAANLTHAQLNHDFGSADKSVKGTLLHLFRSSRAWLARIEQHTSTIPWSVPEDEDWAALEPKWTALQARWLQWGNTLGELDVDRILEYRDLKGNLHAKPLWQVILHVVNHGTHHRGQVAGFLRASGLTPPSLDFVRFVGERPSA